MKINIHHIAQLTNVPLSKKEEAKLAIQLEKTLEHVGRIADIDTSKVSGTNDVTGLHNVTREDEITPSLSQEEALQNAKNIYNGFFVVPVILEEAIE